MGKLNSNISNTQFCCVSDRWSYNDRIVSNEYFYTVLSEAMSDPALMHGDFAQNLFNIEFYHYI